MFASSFIANDFVGKVRTIVFMGVVLPSYAVAGQPKCGFATTWSSKRMEELKREEWVRMEEWL
jgi:hypothetical protein